MNTKYFELDSIGDFFAHFSHTESGGAVPCCSINLTEKVDGNILDKAVKDILKRFPQNSVKLIIQNGKYKLEHNENECPIYNENLSKTRELGKDSNGHLMIFSYWNKQININYSHALSDGMGMLIFVKSLLFQYFKLCNKKVEQDGSILTVEQSPKEDEWANTYPLINCVQIKKPKNAPILEDHFMIPSASNDDDPSDTVVEVNFNFSKLAQSINRLNVGPTAFISTLISKALYENYKNAASGKNIIIEVPINLRPWFPNKSTKNCISLADLIFPIKDADNNLEDNIIKQNYLLKEQTQKDLLLYAAKTLSDQLNYLNANMKNVNFDIVEVWKLLQNRSSCFITNLGNIKLPKSIEQYIENIYFTVFPGCGHYVVSIQTFKDVCTLRISQRSNNTNVGTLLVRYLNKFNIDAKIIKTEQTHTTKIYPNDLVKH